MVIANRRLVVGRWPTKGLEFMLKQILTADEPGAEGAAARAREAFNLATGSGVAEQCSSDGKMESAGAKPAGSAEPSMHAGAVLREQNILGSDATLWFGETTTIQAQTTVAMCQRAGKPCMLIYPTAEFSPSHVATWIREGEFQVLNVAGNREADEPGIAKWVEPFLRDVLQELGHEPRRSI
jgi:Circularly permutated YpsA SLOG family